MIINVEGMHCINCKNRIEKALSEALITSCVNLDEKTVEVDKDFEKAKEIIYDLGFDLV